MKRTVARAGLAELVDEAARAAETVCAKAMLRLAERLAPGGKISAEALDRDQHAAHGLAWFATYATTLRELGAYAATARGTRPVGRDRKPDRAYRSRRISEPDCRRHSDEPGGIRAARRSRPRPRRSGAGLDAATTVRSRQYGGGPRPARRADRWRGRDTSATPGSIATLDEMRDTMRRFVAVEGRALTPMAGIAAMNMCRWRSSRSSPISASSR